MKCLSEIAGLSVGPEYDPKFVVLFAMVMTSVNRMIPPSTGQCHALLISQLCFDTTFQTSRRPTSRPEMQVKNLY